MRLRRVAHAMEAVVRSPHYIMKCAASRCVHEAARLVQDMPFSHNFLFWKELCKKPRSMGALCPSSRHLARCMAQQVTHGKGLVVELGAGTGMVTQALAECLQKDGAQECRRLWALEQSGELAALLARRMPAVNVVQGDARELARILPSGQPVDVIVSGLPLRSFARRDVEAVTRQWDAVLSPEGFVVQFTYALCGADSFRPFGFYEAGHQIVWKNVPPARVQILKRVGKS